ncbi:MAG: hypothetical protein ACYTAS_06225 [Planctomycetota bacterium]|jgi:hypothetical protein
MRKLERVLILTILVLLIVFVYAGSAGIAPGLLANLFVGETTLGSYGLTPRLQMRTSSIRPALLSQ